MDFSDFFDFEWRKDPEGYRIEDGRIFRQGKGKLYPLKKESLSGVHRIFEEVKNENGALGFVDKYGFLGVEAMKPLDLGLFESVARMARNLGDSDSKRSARKLEATTPQSHAQNIESEEVRLILRRAERVRRTMTRLDGHKQSLALLNRAQSLEIHDKELLYGPFNKLLNPDLTIQITRLESQRHVSLFKIIPRGLIDYIELQVALELTGHLAFRACLFCGSVFEFNPNNGNENRLTYCREKTCRQKFSRQKKQKTKRRKSK